MSALRQGMVAPPEDLTREAHREWVSRLWTRIDRDRSGDITRKELDCEEFVSVVKKLIMPHSAGTGGALYSRSELNLKQAMDLCLRKADVNGDRHIAVEEFEAFMWVLRQPSSASTSAHLVFALFDLDCNLQISLEEFRGMLRFFLGHEPTEVFFQSEWGKVAPNGEEEVSEKRYIEWLRTSQHPAFKQFALEAGANEPSRQFSVGEGQALYRVMANSSPNLHASQRSSSMANRPRWNQRFNPGPNPGHVNDHAPLGERRYFSKAQSLPYLKRFWQSYPGTFSAQLRRMEAPEEPPVKVNNIPKVLSSEGGTPMTLPNRHTVGGKMKDPKTGKVTPWEDNFPLPVRFRTHGKAYYRPFAPASTFSEPTREKRPKKPWPGPAGTVYRSKGSRDSSMREEDPDNIQGLRNTAIEAEPW